MDIQYLYILMNLPNYATFSSHLLLNTVIKHQYSSHILLLSLCFIQCHMSLCHYLSFFVSFSSEITQIVILLPARYLCGASALGSLTRHREGSVILKAQSPT